MYSRMEKYHGRRAQRFSIRKYSFGAASVLLGTALLLGANAVKADEINSGSATTTEITNSDKQKPDSAITTPVVEELPETKLDTVKAEVKEDAKAGATPKTAESKPQEVAQAQGTPKAEVTPKVEEAKTEEVIPKLDKSQLDSYVSDISGKIAAGKYSNKTDESVAVLEAELENAKAALVSAKTQDELKAAYNKLVTTVNSKLRSKPVEKKATPAVDTTDGKETVAKKAENTEKKSESNSIDNTELPANGNDKPGANGRTEPQEVAQAQGTPKAEPKETTGKQGQPQAQETESMFKQGDEVAPIDKTTVKLVDPSSNEVTTLPATKGGKEVGTYTIDPTTGVITFQPNKDFTGTPDPAKVVAKDTNGTKVETTYTPTVTSVTPEGTPAETTDIQGKEQNGKPEFKPGNPEVPMDDEVPATFEDGSTEKVVPGEGTYTVKPDGTVTFTPEKTFTGVGTGVTVKRVDKNGTPVTAKYTPTVRPDTSFVDKDGKPLSPTEDGTKPTKDIPGYKVVKTEVDEKGNTKHVYEKVKTSFKDKEGNEIPNYPTEDGEQPKKDLPGYRFVETKKLPNGDTEHVYEKVTTPAPVEPSQPVEPATLAQPVQDAQTPVSKETETKRELPNTGTDDNARLAALGLLGILSEFGLVARKKKED